MKVAFFSGGKESVYAALLEWPVDYLLILAHENPRLSPSPHVLNVGKVAELALSLGVPFIVLRPRGDSGFEELVRVLRALGASVIVAGDQSVEAHLRYMERLANEVGASLKEPLWGMDPVELLYREVRELSFVIVGTRDWLKEMLCRVINEDNVHGFLARARELGISPIGELGEFHTFTTEVKRLGVKVTVGCLPYLEHGGKTVAKLTN